MGLDEGIIYQQKLNRNVKNYSICPPDLALTAAIMHFLDTAVFYIFAIWMKTGSFSNGVYLLN